MSNTRIQPLPSDTSGEAGEVMNAVKQKLGKVPNIMATFAHSPAVLKAYLAYNEALAKGELSAGLREQIALAVAGKNACDYCASAHTAMAKGAGVEADEATRNLEGRATDERTARILAFAQSVVDKRGWVDDSEVAALRKAGITDGELVEIIATIAINIFTNYFNHIAGTEIDFPVVKTDSERRAA